MTADDFRELALELAGVVEGVHMKHPDFRAHGKVFATLGYPDVEWAMVKLEPADQKRFVEGHGQAFVAVKGAWGLQGCTNVRLEAAKRDVVALALGLAWERSAAEAAAKGVPKPKKAVAKKRVAKKLVKAKRS